MAALAGLRGAQTSRLGTAAPAAPSDSLALDGSPSAPQETVADPLASSSGTAGVVRRDQSGTLRGIGSGTLRSNRGSFHR